MNLIVLVVLFTLLQYGSAALNKPMKFFMYELGGWTNISEFTLTPRVPGDKRSYERMDNVINNGLGVEVDRYEGMYHTNQYQLYNQIYHRLKKDPRRTFNPEEATSFFIPYDIASDMAYYIACARNNNNTCYDFRKCPLAGTVEKLLLDSEYYHRNQGRDHVLIVGINYGMKPNCKKFLNGVCTNCTKFAIDDYSFMWGTNEGVLTQGDYWHAVPFPSDFHFNKDMIRPFPWENDDRPYIASYVGSSQSYSTTAAGLKTALAHFCTLHSVSTGCIHYSYGGGGKSDKNERSFEFNNSHQPYMAYRQSIFCFQPIGDMPTRKGLFDGLVQGCIPVVFHDQTANSMYTWHWSEMFWNEVTIRLPLPKVARRIMDPVAYLQNYYNKNREKVKLMQELIRSRVFELHYARDGPYEVPPLAMAADNIRGGEFNKMVESSKKGKSLYYNKRGNISLESTEYNKVTFPSHVFVDPKVVSPGRWVSNSKGEQELIPRVSDGSSSDSNLKSDDKHVSPSNNWPLCGTDMNLNDLKPCRDAYDIIVDYALGFHSNTVKDERIGHIPVCWEKAARLSEDKMKCLPPP